jgi:hypothetical protein
MVPFLFDGTISFYDSIIFRGKINNFRFVLSLKETSVLEELQVSNAKCDILNKLDGTHQMTTYFGNF